jgi:NADPH:quinone reductase-like Zn-dependent oxidoreductase
MSEEAITNRAAYIWGSSAPSAALGADHVIDYRSERFGDKISDVDVVLDTIGGGTQQRSYAVLRAGGMLIATAVPPDEALVATHRVRASFVFHTSDAVHLERLVAEAAHGKLKVLVDRRVD